MLRALREGPEDKKEINLCFFEEIGCPKIGQIVFGASATFTSYPPISIHANNSDMVKFTNASDAWFQSFAGQFRRWMNEIRYSRPS